MLGTMTAVMVTAAVFTGSLIAVRVLPNTSPESDKRATLEGLRGMLALFVVAHHLLTMRGFAATGRWPEPPGNFDNLLGKGAVAMFFMLSAYLFCGTAITRGGRLTAAAIQESVATWLSSQFTFLVGRARRIMPAYLFTVLMLVLMVGVETRFTLREPPERILREIACWALLGLDAVNINGFASTWKMFSVTWSLRTEAQFYLMIPLLALGARKGKFAPVILLLIPAMLFDWWPMFAIGALAVPIAQERFTAWRWPAAVGLIVLVWTQHSAAGWIAALLLLPAFVGAAQGARGFRWLGHPAMVRLGQVSYSLYLLHNPVIYMMGLWFVGRHGFATASLPALLPIALATSVLAVFAAAIVQHWVERPFMARRPSAAPAGRAEIPEDADQHDCVPDRASKPHDTRSKAATVTKELLPWPI